MHLLTIYRSELKNYIHTDFRLEVLDDTCLFSEGPVWSRKGYYLFSDIPSNIISKIVPGEHKEVFLKDAGCSRDREVELPRMMGSDGLAFDHEDKLLICQHGNHCVAVFDGTKVQPLITHYQQKILNSPNDIVAGHTGKVFFSDPPYGLKDQVLNPGKYQPHAGFYCWQQGELTLFCKQYQYPNGVCFSPDQRFVYTCSNKPFEAAVLEFDAQTLALKRTVCKETSDGIKCDRYGNLYLCNKAGILILDGKGQRLGLIELPTIPANICWGGKNGDDLLITARENIFFISELMK